MSLSIDHTNDLAIATATPTFERLNASEVPNVTEAEPFEALARELDAIRSEALATRGPRDERYIRRMIWRHRALDLTGRALLTAGVFPPAFVLGAGILGLAKILENMEIGHNVMHGQWDWLNDPDIHSTTWEWDNVVPAEQWKNSHNYLHHQWTNVRGMDRDIGYGAVRVDPEQPWKRDDLASPFVFVALALVFEYGISIHDNEHFKPQAPFRTDWDAAKPKLAQTGKKIRSQVLKDYVAFPLLALPFGLPGVATAMAGALVANTMRNVWSFAVIFCGHFPDDVEYFDKESVENETRGGWYRRQILGSANFTGGKLTSVMSGNLNYQIEHHLFPDMPSNRYAEVAPKVKDVCERHGLRYNTKSMRKQLATVVRKVIRLSFPN